MTTILQSMTMVGGRIMTCVFQDHGSSFLLIIGDMLAYVSCCLR